MKPTATRRAIEALLRLLTIAAAILSVLGLHDFNPGVTALAAACLIVPPICGATPTITAWVYLAGTVATIVYADVYEVPIAASWFAGWGGLVLLAYLVVGVLKLGRRRRTCRTEGGKLIALGGYARSGKDTAAAALIAAGWHHASFAAKMKALAYDINPLIELDHNDGYVRLAQLVDDEGWEKAKETSDVRRFLQHLGTDARTHLGENIWVEAAFADLPAGKDVVFTDARFPNERAAVKAAGGFNVRVNRPGIKPLNSHPSETSVDAGTYDVTLDNDSDVAALHARIRYLAVAVPARCRPVSRRLPES